MFICARLKNAHSFSTQQEDDAAGAEFKRKWESLQKVLERQKEKGGVIDPEAESNRFLIHINDVSPENMTLHFRFRKLF